MSSGRRKDAFLVNLWAEPSDAPHGLPADWRGSVEHLVTQHKRYFNDLSELIAFLAPYVGPIGPRDTEVK
jgi:hypothetical protein